jgi:hypothetical protein
MEIARHQPTEEEQLKDNVNHAITDPLRAHELQNGSLTSGPVAQQLERSTRADPGSPFEGRAVFSVAIDELGFVVGAQVADSSGDRQAWESVARHLVNAFAQKRVHMPPGAKGASLRIEVTSKVTMPSGARRALEVTSPMGSALVDMAHGKMDKAPDTPAPISGGFDLADIGAHPLRVVGAHVVSESVF